jgi:hypothetical protein
LERLFSLLTLPQEVWRVDLAAALMEAEGLSADQHSIGPCQRLFKNATIPFAAELGSPSCWRG